jgi:nitrate reductase NapAB chaperone NapD
LSLNGSEESYDLSSAVSQPEVTTMTMNGRDVVVIDAELFSQIIDELQTLKMKLSQLNEVIQV